MRNGRLLRVLTFLFAVSCLSSAVAQSVEEQNLHELIAIGHQYISGAMDASAFKSQTDAILSSETEASQKANLVYALVRIISRNVPRHVDDILLYSEEALLLPLTPVQKAQVLSYRASAFKLKATSDHVHERKLKLSALTTYLQCLDIVVNNQKQQEIQPLPSVDSFDIPGQRNNQLRLKAQGEQQKQLANRQLIEDQNHFVELRHPTDNQIRHLFQELELAKKKTDTVITENISNPTTRQYVQDNLLPK